ncbi:hypothetical protein [Wolbachia endosymbiont (group B) of Idaea biselata]|uniref:hypothetical protein n=1 Tax=Wolbachia endosymbiont (group B) of Idaea biselata TaxID=3066179 RepID=UPI0031330BCF
MLPGRWNKWAENILHHNQVIVVNGVQTDNLFNSDREKELKDENEKLQEKLKEMNELTEQVKSLGEEKEIFAKFFAAQAQQIEDLELENEELKSKLEEIKKSYKELEAITQKRGEEFLAQFKEKSKEILDSQKELIERSKEFVNKIEMLTVEIEKKDGKIRSLTQLNEVLEQEKKEMEDKNNAQQQIILDQEEKIEKQGALITSLTDKNKDINETVKKDNEILRAQNTDLESKVSQLKDKSDTQIKELKNQLKEKQAEFTQAEEKILNLEKKLESSQQQLVQKNTGLTNQLQDLSSKLHAAEIKKKELEDEVNELKEKAKGKDAEVENLKQQLEKEKDELKDSISKLNAAETEKKELEDEITKLQAHAEEKNAEVENLKQQSEKDKSDSSNKLSATETEKKELESKIASLQEQVQTLEKGKEWESSGIDDSLKQTHSNLIEMLEKKLAEQEKQIEQLQEKRKQEEDQAKANITKLQEEKKGLLAEINSLRKKLESSQNITLSSVKAHSETLREDYKLKIQQIENSVAGSEQQNGKLTEDTKEQAKALDTVSIASTAKSTISSSKSTSSKLQNLTNKLRRDNGFKNFLSKKNEELKKGFPEFEGKHFCHNVLGETIKSLSNQSDGKFESNKLLALLKENLVKSGKAIIETKFNKVVEELAKDFVKKHDLKQVIFVERCAEKLYLNEEDSKAIINSFTEFLAQKNVSNNDSVKKFVVQKLTEAEMKCFSDKIQQLASSIRDKFLSPDQGMCVQTSKENNEYELTDKAKKEYTPNSSMSHSNTTNVSKGRFK